MVRINNKEGLFVLLVQFLFNLVGRIICEMIDDFRYFFENDLEKAMCVCVHSREKLNSWIYQDMGEYRNYPSVNIESLRESILIEKK